MQFNVSFIQTQDRVVIRKFDLTQNNIEEVILNLEDLKFENLNLIIYPKDNDSLSSFLNDEIKFAPIISKEQLNLDIETFNNLKQDEAIKLLLPYFDKWITLNNLSTIEEIFSLSSHLKDLWKNDRTAFFEELWFFLRSNLGTSYLRIIFHDVISNKLTESFVDGTKYPEVKSGGEPEKAMMSHYEKHLYQTFEIIEWDDVKKEGLISASIDKGPILIMLKAQKINPLQKSLLKALFLGLQS